MTEYTMLAEKENFLRFRDCDFNTLSEYQNNNIKNLENSQLPATLKKCTSPLLLLFYYEDTEREILTEFFESSNGRNMEKGNSEDSLFEGDDMEFKFGFVNLDSEEAILETFQEMNGLNPFSWAKIEKQGASYQKYPFIIFYYNTLPQFMYEGLVDSESIKLEFKNWRSELIEIENKEMTDIKSKILTKEGYFTALEDDKPFPNIIKGKTYWITVTKDSSGLLDYTIKPI